MAWRRAWRRASWCDVSRNGLRRCWAASLVIWPPRGFPLRGVGGVVAPGLVSGSPVGSLVGILVGWLGREGSGRLRELGAAAILRLARYRCEPKNLSGTLMAAGPSLAVGWVVEGRLAPRSVAPSLVVIGCW